MHHCETNLNKKIFSWGGALPLLIPLSAFGTRVTVHIVLHTFYYLPAPMIICRMLIGGKHELDIEIQRALGLRAHYFSKGLHTPYTHCCRALTFAPAVGL